MENLLRATEVAKIMNIQVATVYELARRRVLPHVRLTQGPRRALVRFKPSEIERLVQDRSIPASPKAK